jgi:flavin reductase (DIM6/NTAB) family NADH-FMN oxidoreductase RutF
MLHVRRAVILPALRRHTSTSTSAPVQAELRALLRETAQPVAVVCARLGDGLHGATLSSFASVALAPHALVAFSLRVPSRMARALAAAHTSSESDVHMVVNVLSAAQAPLAHRFARADLFPTPFAGLDYALTADGLPILAGSLGALSCTLVSPSWPLHDLATLDRAQSRPTACEDTPWAGEDVTSELFIARVERVERRPANDAADDDADPTALPLLYHRRKYTTTALPFPE